MATIHLLLNSMDFKPKDSTKNIYHKRYKSHNYEIAVNFTDKNIDYPAPIKLGDKTTSNFSKDENFVVLECVNRLLEIGYPPNCIELERNFPLGINTKGKLDICVYDANKSVFLMIECKTFEEQYEKEYKRTLSKGGQIFSYFQQDDSTKFLCLYSSKFDTDIKIKCGIIECTDILKSAENADKKYKLWNKQFHDTGIFEIDVEPYTFKPRNLCQENLISLKEDDSRIIYNEFVEILRHNVVSDKGNAFNKIFNLFLCKLHDESKLDGENLDFQWKENDTSETFLMRLNKLYADGVKQYLDKNIINLTVEDIDELLANGKTERIKRKVTEALLYKSNEFAFIDVFDKDSFERNAMIVKEIVILLQKYRIRYSHKQQFLGDFFERLLNTGFKQESGQYFTPVPLARFMVNSLPIKEITQDKLRKKEGDFLPYVIDYAMGTGHFLTEMMDEMQNVIASGELRPSTRDAKHDLEDYKSGNFKWAERFIYGIEKDYRLVKTAKVACFLHGDGLAKIIQGDGLARFNSKEYTGMLRNDDGFKDNPKFDIIIANPPYSVSAFKHTLKDGKDAFDIYDNLTDNSSEIECLFIERAKQLLKEEGYGAIIFPLSILSDPKSIYVEARKILLSNFEIYGMCELGGNAFAKTEIRTVVLFFKKRSESIVSKIEAKVKKFLDNKDDITLNGTTDVFSKYAHEIHGITFEDYQDKIEQMDSEVEFKMLTVYLLNIEKRIIIIKSGEKNPGKDFLGYDTKSNRRGHEGINIYKDENEKPINKLFNQDDRDDESKSSFYLYQAGLGNFDLEIHDDLKGNLSYKSFNELIKFSSEKFEYAVTTKKKKYKKSCFPLEKISKICETIESGKRPTGGVDRIRSGAFSLGGEHIDAKTGRVDVITKPKYVPFVFYEEAIKSQGELKENDILICKDGALTGKVAILKDELSDQKAMVNEHVFLLRTDNLITQYYLFYFLYSDEGQEIIEEYVTRTAQGGLNKTNLKKIEIPLPPIEIQEDIVKKCKEVDDKINVLLSTPSSTQINKKEEVDNLIKEKNGILDILWIEEEYNDIEDAD